MKFRKRTIPVPVLSKMVQFAFTARTWLVETQSAISYVSVHGDDSHETPLNNTKATVSGIYENAKKRDLGLGEAQTSKKSSARF